MMLKQRLLGSGLMPSSLSALLMMVVIWPRKKRTLVGSTAPSWLNTASSALRSCGRGEGVSVCTVCLAQGDKAEEEDGSKKVRLVEVCGM